MTESTARDVLAVAIHDAMCPTSHHDYRDGIPGCIGWAKYPNIAASVIPKLAARGYALSSQPEATGEAGLRAALTALPRQSIPDDGNIGRHNAGQWREASGYVEVVGLSAALAALALPEPER